LRSSHGQTPAHVENGRLVGSTLFSDSRLQRVLAALDGDGEEVRIAGGAVRNALMGEPVNDVDLATTATPDVVQARAAKAGLRTVPTGIEHGTITVLVEGVPFEVTTLRQDVDTFGRHATVLFGRDFEADAHRRDFTINALSVDARGGVHDYCGGLEDIAARRVRFIGEAAKRIREDYLRILRLFRFHASCGASEIDAEALHASIELRRGLDILSRERVRAELLKILIARRAADAIEVMSETGILQMLLAGIGVPARLRRFTAIELQRGQSADAVARLASLAVFVADDATRLREHLRLSNDEELRLGNAARALAEWHGQRQPPAPNDLYRFLFAHGRRAALDAAALAQAESGAAADDAGWASAFAFLQDTPEPRLPFSGKDLVKRGLHPGPAIGETLKRLQAAWIRAGFPREPEVLARLLDEAERS
jgi:poly(A) polymerase